MSQDRLTRIETKIDSMTDKLSAIDVTLVKQHESLKHHIKRTDMLEDELRPIRKNMTILIASAKILIYSSIIATIIDVVWRIVLGGKL